MLDSPNPPIPNVNKMHFGFLYSKDLLEYQGLLYLGDSRNYAAELYLPRLTEDNYKQYQYESIDTIPEIENSFTKMGFKKSNDSHRPWSLNTTTFNIREIMEYYQTYGSKKGQCKIL